ncbi:orotidine-5'-phosphate decarboxylase [Thiomicrospira sp. WB1]|uniref:orotidine-5'-phosphate decarboxylase n=1 Tax=Thiomicrospira sp. WB1 TaxID=1685380 RepID=UPI0007470043|nr:orotidine-5'-phosphate decarboxylase [Thiomicrospira sp. WB1]KUJ72038.1 orotidine 5'-phosphate decarboxylase [Thiomicrospira sp. WB1]
MSHIASPRIIVALDYDRPEAALSLVDRLNPSDCRLKVGKELFAAGGPELVKTLVKRGFDVFLDLKYHDIPTTVAKACRAAAELGVWMLNVHALGGRKMMEAAKAALAESPDSPLLIAVTVLTSHSASDLEELGLPGTPEANVMRLAGLAKEAGLDGVVCSAREANALRRQFGEAFQLVTPGIRPVEASLDDQQRVMSPEEAIEAGSSYLVIGRPITQAADPQAALDAINHSIA